MYLASIPPSFFPTPRRGIGAIDFSTFSTEDWLLVGIGAMAIYAFASPGSRLFTASPSVGRRRRGKKSRGGFGMGAITALILAGGGYLAYQLATSGSSGGAG